ncbi:MAG: hypothetical protein ABII00_04555 [Elusimicrobiota bacterium]
MAVKSARRITGTKILINYPQLHERILPRHYSFRIEAKVHGQVELSIDGSPWRACRPSMGYWWYDWHCAPAGSHKVVARVLTETGAATTNARPFRVISELEILSAVAKSAKPATRGARSARHRPRDKARMN